MNLHCAVTCPESAILVGWIVPLPVIEGLNLMRAVVLAHMNDKEGSS